MTDDLAWQLCECVDAACDCRVCISEAMTADDLDTLAIWVATWQRTEMERGEG